MRLFLSLACPPRFKESVSLCFFFHAPYVDPPSDKALIDSLGEALLKELFSE
jgi:hypothetical protein